MTKKSGVHGLKELETALNELTPAVSKRVTRKALRESAWIITREAQALAKARLQRLTGRLFRGINQGEGRQIRKPKGAVSMAFKIGFTNAAPHGPMLEFGTGPRKTKDGKSTGVGPAFRFMTDAWHGKKDAAKASFEQAALRIVEEEAAKLAKT